jgi:hypothetical protein
MKTNFYLTDRTDRRELDIDKFINSVCLEFGAEKSKVLSIARKGEIILIRKVLIYFIQKRSLINNIPPTLNKTASYFNGEQAIKVGGVRKMDAPKGRSKNHATIINSVNRHIELREVGDLDYHHCYCSVEAIFNRLTNFREHQEQEMLLLVNHFFNSSKLIKLGRYIGENYSFREQLKELLSKDREIDLLAKELEKSTLDNEPFNSLLVSA